MNTTIACARTGSIGKQNFSFSLFFFIAIALLAVTLSGSTAYAATVTWDGGSGSDDNWDTLGNWDIGGTPAAADTVVFATAFTSGTSISLNGNRTVAALSVTSTTDFSLDNNVLTISTGAITRSAATGTTTINSGIAIGAAAAWNITGDLIANGIVDDGVGSFLLTKSGTGTLTLSGNNTFGGGLSVTAGTIVLGHDSAAGTGLLNLATGVTINGAGGLRTIANAFDVDTGTGSTVTFGGTDLKFTASFDPNLAFIYDVNNTTEFSGAITGGDALTKTGTGNMILSGIGANGTGLITVNAGTLTLSKTGAIAVAGGLTIGDGTLTDTVQFTASDQINNGSAVIVNSSGVLNLATFSDTIGNLTVTGGSVTTGGGSLTIGTLTMTAGSIATSTGTLTLGGAVTTVADAASATISGLLALGGSTRTFTIGAGAAADDMVISAVISGAAGVGITKITAGSVLVLSGANTYGGDTTITTGTIKLGADNVIPNGVGKGNVSVAVGGTLDLAAHSDTINGLSGAGTVDNSTGVGSYTLTLGDNNATGAANTFSGVIKNTSGTVNVIKNGSGTLTLSGANAFTGFLSIREGTVSVNSITANGVAGPLGAGSAFLGDLGTTGTLDYTGGDLAVTKDFTIIFGGAGGVFQINAAATDLTLNGVIANSGTLTKTGLGVLVLGGANTGSGDTTISGGVLRLNNASALHGGNLTINGGVLELQNPTSLTRFLGSSSGQVQITGGQSGFSAFGSPATINLGGVSATLVWGASGEGAASGFLNPTKLVLNTNSATAALDFQNGLDLNGATRTIIVNANAATISSPIINTVPTAGLTKEGTGTLILSANNTYDGVTTISAGILQIGNGGTTGTLGTGNVTDSAALVFNRSTASSYGGIISGAGTVTNNGTGTLTLSGVNTYTGATAVNAGVVKLQNNAALGGIGAGTFVVAGGSIQIDGTGLSFAEPISILGGDGGGGGALRNLANANTWTGTIVIADTGARINSDIGALLTLSAISEDGASLKTVTFGGDGNITVTGTITAGGNDLALTKDGAGTLILGGAGANTYDGVTTVNDGRLELGKTAVANAFSSASLVIGDGTGTAGTAEVRLTTVNQQMSTSVGVSILGDGLFNLSGNSQTIGALTMTGGSVTTGIGTLTVGGTVTANAAATSATISGNLNLGAGAPRTFTIDDGAAGEDMVISAIISNGALTKGGAGTLTLSGVNTFAGALTVSAGTLSIGTINNASTAGVLGNSANAVVLGGAALTGTLQYTGATAASTKTFTMGTAGGVFQIDSGATTLTLSGIIGDAGGVNDLTKTGAGTLELGGGAANTYTGVTTVNEGTLLLSKTAGNAIAGALTIGDGIGGAGVDIVRLTANDQIAGTTVTVNSSGRLNLDGFSDTIGGLTMTAGSVTTGLGTLTLGANVIGNANAASATISGNLSLGTGVRTFTIADQVGLADDMAISAIISGGAGNGLTKLGAGTLTLSGLNTFNGVLSVSEGKLSIGSINDASTAGVLGNSANAVVLGGAALTGTLQYTGPTAASTKTFTMGTAGGVFQIDSGATTLTLSGIIGDAGGVNDLTKTGAGTLELGGGAANTYTGVTTVNEGTLLLSKTAGNAIAGALTIGDGIGGAGVDIVRLTANNQIAATAVTVNSSGLLNLNTFSDTVGSLTVNGGSVTTGGGSLTITTLGMTAGSIATGAGTLTLGGNVTGTANAASATISGNLALGAADRTFTIADQVGLADDMVISAAISGGANIDLIKSGAGTLVLSGDNSAYVGVTTINSGGALNIRNANALGSVGALVNTIVNAGGALQIQGGITTAAEALTINGAGVAADGALRNISSDNTYAGLVTVATSARINSDLGTLTLSGGIDESGTALKTLTIGGAGNVTVTGAITETGGTVAIPDLALVKDGAGILALNATGTYHGGTTLGTGAPNTGGTITLGADGALGDGGFTFAGGVLNANNKTHTTTGALTLTADSTLNLVDDLVADPNALTFGSITRTGGILTITGWVGNPYTSGTDDQLFVGLANPGATILASIHFDGFADGAFWISGTGEIVPVPEPINVALGIFAGVFLVFGVGRRYAKSRQHA